MNQRCEDELDRLEQDLQVTLEHLIRLRAEQRATILVPADILHHAVDVLMPAERMGVSAGRLTAGRLMLTTMYDVTGIAGHVHVRADARKLACALTGFDRSGVELLAWIHSHPGSGAGATLPSPVDRQQYADWVRHYTDQLVGIIVVEDGFVRFWGDAVERNRVRIAIVGQGVRRVEGAQHVYRLDR